MAVQPPPGNAAKSGVAMQPIPVQLQPIQVCSTTICARWWHELWQDHAPDASGLQPAPARTREQFPPTWGVGRARHSNNVYYGLEAGTARGCAVMPLSSGVPRQRHPPAASQGSATHQPLKMRKQLQARAGRNNVAPRLARVRPAPAHRPLPRPRLLAWGAPFQHPLRLLVCRALLGGTGHWRGRKFPSLGWRGRGTGMSCPPGTSGGDARCAGERRRGAAVRNGRQARAACMRVRACPWRAFPTTVSGTLKSNSMRPVGGNAKKLHASLGERDREQRPHAMLGGTPGEGGLVVIRTAALAPGSSTEFPMAVNGMSICPYNLLAPIPTAAKLQIACRLPMGESGTGGFVTPDAPTTSHRITGSVGSVGSVRWIPKVSGPGREVGSQGVGRTSRGRRGCGAPFLPVARPPDLPAPLPLFVQPKRCEGSASGHKNHTPRGKCGPVDTHTRQRLCFRRHIEPQCPPQETTNCKTRAAGVGEIQNNALQAPNMQYKARRRRQQSGGMSARDAAPAAARFASASSGGSLPTGSHLERASPPPGWVASLPCGRSTNASSSDATCSALWKPPMTYVKKGTRNHPKARCSAPAVPK
eukprot:gene11614-biopygen337